MYKRILNLPPLLKKKSFFLLGPRSTGKTTLISHHFPKTKVYDLLNTKTYMRLLKNPELLIEETEGNTYKLIIIDEIQKLPSLLDSVQLLIQKKNKRFLLTGSSARKLKRGGANLLAGRAWQAGLFPLVWGEIPHFNLKRYLNRGGLPVIYDSASYQEELEAYINLYLKEEIQDEAFARHVGAFVEFLDLIALSNGEEINYRGFSSDLQISPTTLKNYIEILNDTLVGFPLPAYTKTKKRKAISRSKYYLFDIGVTNYLCHRGEIKEKSDLWGKVFEHFIVLEIRAFLSYSRKRLKMHYWRSTSKMEVDLVIDQALAIEIKSVNLVRDRHLKGLRALKEEGLIKQYIVVSMDEETRVTQDKITILPWKVFLKQLWEGKII